MVDEKVEDVEVSKEVEPKEVKSKEVKKIEDRYVIAEVVTETGIAVKDNKTEKILNQLDLQVEILNKVDKLVRALV